MILVEGESEALLRELYPSANLFNLATALFREFWNSRIASAAAQAKAEVARVERAISQFLDRIVEADNPTVIKAYESRIRSLAEEKAALREQAARSGKPLTDFDATLRTALESSQSPRSFGVLLGSRTNGRC